MDTKEKIAASAMKAFKTVDVPIGDSMAQMRELSKPEREALDGINFEKNEDGSFKEDDKGYLIISDYQKYIDNWIVATLEPKFTVEEIANWPMSLKKDLLEKAKRVNSIEPADSVAKN